MKLNTYRFIEYAVTCTLATVVWLLPDTVLNCSALLILGTLFSILALASIALFIEGFEGIVSIDRTPHFTFGDVTFLYCANVFLYTKHYILFSMVLFIIVVQLLKLIKVRKEVSGG